MTEGYVRKLLKASSRMDVLESMPIYCGSYGQEWLGDKHTGPAHAHTLDYKHVPKAERIHHFDLRPEQFNRGKPYLKLEMKNAQVTGDFQCTRQVQAPPAIA